MVSILNDLKEEIKEETEEEKIDIENNFLPAIYSCEEDQLNIYSNTLVHNSPHLPLYSKERWVRNIRKRERLQDEHIQCSSDSFRHCSRILLGENYSFVEERII